MADVEFNEPTFESSQSTRALKEPSRLSKLAMATGLAKDEKSAQIVLLVTALICVGLAALVFFSNRSSSPQTPPVTMPVESI